MDERTGAVSGHDSTTEIRRDIEQTQREMSRTIDEIQHRLSPHYMMERTKRSVREAGVRTSRSFIDRITSNPLPVAMIGAGLFLMFRDHDEHEEYVDVAGMRDRAERALDSARESASQAASQSRDLLSENPLVAGLAAAAMGALLGALIPETSREHELMGPARDKLADRARQAAREGIGRAREMATHVAAAAKETAKQEVGKTDIGRNIGVGETTA